MLCIRHLALVCLVGLFSFACTPSENKSEDPPTRSFGSLVFFGENLSQVSGLEDPKLSFLNLLQEEIHSRKLSYHVQDAGIGLENSQMAVERIEGFLESPIEIMLIVVGLGKDALPLEKRRENIQQMIDLSQSKYPMSSVVLVNASEFGENEVPPMKMESMLMDLAINNQTALIPLHYPTPNPNSRLQLLTEEEIHQLLKQQIWEGLEPLL